jgi:hypothetical protein
MTRADNLEQVQSLGISWEDATALRRASMTLRRWYERECGDSNNYASFSLERDEATNIPYQTIYRHDSNKVSRYRVPDRETGARKRIEAILAKYGLRPYYQTDPRGCALYIIRDGDVPPGADASAYYTRGIPVY